jgi:hypothetical protein
MIIHRTIWTACIQIAALLVCCAMGIAGGEKAKSASAPLRIPSMLYREADVLGSRLKMRGKEKTIYNGEFFDSTGKSQKVRITQELQGTVKLEGFKANGKSLYFDGKNTFGVTSRAEDEGLLEAFFVDYPEGMLISLQNGATARLMGRGFGPDPRVQPNYSGPRYDIYEVTGRIPCREDKLIRTKRYYFDSQTGYLQSVRYYDHTTNPPTKNETRFSVWGIIDGSAYPARIDFYSGGRRAFTFIATEIDSEEQATISASGN